jgi:hypothetical protein
MENKPDPALLRASYLSNEIKKKAKISWDSPFKISGYAEFYILIAVSWSPFAIY